MSSTDRRSDAIAEFEISDRCVEVGDGEYKMIDDGHVR